jgi:hypothetical protein
MGDNTKIPPLPTTGNQGRLAAAFTNSVPQDNSNVPDLEVDLDDEVAIDQPVQDKAQDKAQDNKPKVEDKKLENELKDKGTKPADKKDDTFKPFVTPKPEEKNAARDYSDIPDEWKEYAKDLKNDRFNKFKAELPKLIAQAKESEKYRQENETLRKEKPGFLFEHPEAFRLDPEYNKIVSETQINQYLLDHYNKQILEAAAGRDWVTITGFKDDGTPITAVTKGSGQRDVQGETAIATLLAQLGTSIQTGQQRLQGYNTQFGELVKQSDEYMRGLEEKFFPGWDEAKLNDKQKGYIKAIDGVIPPVFKHQKAWGITKKIAVAYYDLQEAHQKALQKIADLEERGEARSGSGGGVKPSGGGESGSDEFFVDTSKEFADL